MSQQIEEPCILPNPKVPGRLVMLYGAVSASNRVVAAIGKAWADARSPFRWHQDEANPVFRPGATGWDATPIRLDAVLSIPEEDSYYIGLVYVSLLPRQGWDLAGHPARDFHRRQALDTLVQR